MICYTIEASAGACSTYEHTLSTAALMFDGNFNRRFSITSL